MTLLAAHKGLIGKKKTVPPLRDSVTFTNDKGNLSLDLDALGLDYAVDDTIIVAFTFDTTSDSSWSWVSTGTDIALLNPRNRTAYQNPGGYIGTAVIASGKSTLSTTGVSASAWMGVSGVIASFAGYEYSARTSRRSGTTGMPDPHGLTVATNDIIVAIGLLDDDAITATAPSGYTLINSGNHTYSGNITTTMMAYKLSAGATENPGAFGGGGNDRWTAYSYSLTEI